ncbi:FAD-dependent oxidoreductase [Listeria aquatica]|uniref:FAD-dependent oxidoreductase n=1 Tax=Listeria aquatica TaxID=1494960 RepID=UPI003EF50D34
MKIVIVGGSHGGYAMMESALEQYPKAEICLIEKGFMQLPIPEKIKIMENTEATGLDASNHELTVKQQKNFITISFDKLLLAPGAEAFMPPAIDASLEGVTAMRTRTQINLIKSSVQSENIKNIVVVGGGYIGLGAADIFSKNGKNVTLIDNSSHILSTYLDTEFAKKIEANLRKRGVTIRLGESVKSLAGEKKVQSVLTTNNSYSADLVVVATGTRPNTSWLKGSLDLSDRGFIKVDAYLRTSVPDVFAVGDSIEIPYTPLYRQQSIALASNAQRQGECAILNLEKPRLAYKSVLGTTSWAAGKYHFSATGLTEKAAESFGLSHKSITITQQQNLETHNGLSKIEVQLKLLYSPNDQKVLGFQIMANGAIHELINIAAIALQKEMTLSELALVDFYMLPGINFLPHIINEAAFKALRAE